MVESLKGTEGVKHLVVSSPLSQIFLFALAGFLCRHYRAGLLPASHKFLTAVAPEGNLNGTVASIVCVPAGNGGIPCLTPNFACFVKVLLERFMFFVNLAAGEACVLVLVCVAGSHWSVLGLFSCVPL